MKVEVNCLTVTPGTREAGHSAEKTKKTVNIALSTVVLVTN